MTGEMSYLIDYLSFPYFPFSIDILIQALYIQVVYIKSKTYTSLFPI